MEARERFPADEGIPAIAGKTNHKYLWMILWACLSAVCLGGGSIACGLLSQEENATTAVLLFLAALAEAAGCMFFFYRFLREISPKPKPPFITTLH
jgi:drug/metabolite transporter (DMT)-like permease